MILLDEADRRKYDQVIAIEQPSAPAQNYLGIFGFIAALHGLVFFWVPFFGWMAWIVGLVLSSCGMAKKPKTLAVAGLVMSGVVLLFWVVIVRWIWNAANAG